MTEIYNMGYYYYTGKNGYPLDYKKAFVCFNKAAESGMSSAMNYLGIMYETGKGVERDYRMAVNWFYKAIQADSGNAMAAFNLGRMYYSGCGVEKNMPKAYEFFKAAVDLGRGNTHSAYPLSCYNTGCILAEYYKNNEAAYPYFYDAAKYGNITGAWHNLGYFTERGVMTESSERGAKEGKAIAFYKKAAEAGYAPSMDAIGRLYLTANMIDEARYWLEKAAALGDEMARKRLKMLKISQSGSLLDLFL